MDGRRWEEWLVTQRWVCLQGNLHGLLTGLTRCRVLTGFSKWCNRDHLSPFALITYQLTLAMNWVFQNLKTIENVSNHIVLSLAMSLWIWQTIEPTRPSWQTRDQMSYRHFAAALRWVITCQQKPPHRAGLHYCSFRSVLNSKSKKAGRLGRWWERQQKALVDHGEGGPWMRPSELSSSSTVRRVKLAARSGLWKSPSDPGNIL